MRNHIIFVLLLFVVAFLFTFTANINAAELGTHIFLSLYRMLVGYTLSVALSMLFAVLLGLSRYLRMAFRPILSFFISIPTITWVPLLLVVTGITEKTIVIAIVLGSFFAITFNALDGFDNVSGSLLRAGRILGYGRLRTLVQVVVPASFNSILVGLKLGIAYSWRALVGAEMLGAAEQGLGYLVFASRRFYDLKLMFLSLALIGALGFVLNRVLVETVENKTIVRWGIR